MEWESFLPPLIGSFVGVLVGFGLNRRWTNWIEEKTCKTFYRDIKKELKNCLDRLTGEGKLLPNDIWKSGVSSGLLQLIPYEIKHRLASVYFKIECFNYEATRVRDISVMVGTGEQNLQLLHYSRDLSNKLRESEEALKKEISEILEIDIGGAMRKDDKIWERFRTNYWSSFDKFIRPIVMIWLFIVMVYTTYLLVAIQDPNLLTVKIAVFGISVAAFVNFISLFFGWRTEERFKEILEILKSQRF
jgi:hypothetical protein